MITARRTLASAAVAVILVITAGASVWLMASSGAFSGAEQALPGAPVRVEDPGAEESSGTIPVVAGIQAGQPRNPFEPLIDPPEGDGPPPTDEGDTTTTTDATSTTTGDDTTTTTGDTTTTTTLGDDPDGTRVLLLEVRDENGALVAVVEVDGETFTVGVGETFAEDFKVVSLTETGGVFTFGDSAFTLAVGQSILK